MDIVKDRFIKKKLFNPTGNAKVIIRCDLMKVINDKKASYNIYIEKGLILYL